MCMIVYGHVRTNLVFLLILPPLILDHIMPRNLTLVDFKLHSMSKTTLGSFIK